MNNLIKIILFVWLLGCALFVWVGVAVIGLCLAFTNLSFITAFTPFIGLSVVICIIKCAMLLLKSNPSTYVDAKVEAFFGKKKI